MVLWNNTMGGEFPWDPRYYQENPDTSDGFDPTYIMQHATDSASTAGCMATGHKAAVNMMSVDLYEEKVSTIVEDAMLCGKAGGVVSSVPMFHATPGAFITHANSRSDREALRDGFKQVNPTMASGVCGGRYYPDEEMLESMKSGALSSQWTFLAQDPEVKAEVSFSKPVTSVSLYPCSHGFMCTTGLLFANRRFGPRQRRSSACLPRWRLFAKQTVEFAVPWPRLELHESPLS